MTVLFDALLSSANSNFTISLRKPITLFRFLPRSAPGFYTSAPPWTGFTPMSKNATTIALGPTWVPMVAPTV